MKITSHADVNLSTALNDLKIHVEVICINELDCCTDFMLHLLLTVVKDQAVLDYFYFSVEYCWLLMKNDDVCDLTVYILFNVSFFAINKKLKLFVFFYCNYFCCRDLDNLKNKWIF